MTHSKTEVPGWTDREGRKWATAVSVTTIGRVKETTGVNLLEIAEGQLLPRFLDDPLLLVDVLYVVCKPQADERSVSKEGFGTKLAWGREPDAASLQAGTDWHAKRARAACDPRNWSNHPNTATAIRGNLRLSFGSAQDGVCG